MRADFVAITDHSVSLTIAHGMTVDELENQGRRIDAINARMGGDRPPFEVLRSIEMDVFADGAADLDLPLRARLDLVLGAFHSKLRSVEGETERYLAALRLPALHVLAHPTARMFGRRPGLRADWRRVFAEAGTRGKAVEIGATMWRQDLSAKLAEIAVSDACRGSRSESTRMGRRSSTPSRSASRSRSSPGYLGTGS